MRIGIDIDNTLTDIQKDLNNAAYKYANSLNKKINFKNLELIDKKNDGNIYQKAFGFTHEELKYFLKNIQENITNNAIPREGVLEFINKLHSDGHEIYMITARDLEFHDDPYKQSEEWLKKNNIYYDKLIVNARIKGKVCKEEKVDLFIDDNINNCLDVKRYGIKTICLNTNNCCKDKIPIFDNWTDIYNYIKKTRNNKMYDYVLQLGFDKQTEDFIQNIKNTLKEKNVIDKEKNWRPHITIDLYNCDNEKLFIKHVDRVINNIKMLNIEFNNLNNFDDKTLYIEPFNKNDLKKIKALFDISLSKFRLENRKNRIYKPHVTLCTNDDLSSAIKISEDMFKPFVGKVAYLWIYNPQVNLIKEYSLDES